MYTYLITSWDFIQGSMEYSPVYSTKYCQTLQGWPDCRQQVAHITSHFWGAQDELSIKSGLFLKETRVCVPLELLHCTLADLHGAHQGIDRMKAQARGAVYWLSIDANIANNVCWCTICTKHKPSPPDQPMLPRDIPNGLWQEITPDFFIHKGKEYLLVCDLFSKYPFLFMVSSKFGQSLPKHLFELILQYRMPCLLYTDNSPTIYF